MKNIKLHLKNRSYDIVIGNNAIKRLAKFLIKLDIGSDAYIITNSVIKKKYGNMLGALLKQAHFSVRFKSVPDSEKSKSLDQASSIIREIARYDNKKQAVKQPVFIVNPRNFSS